MAGASDERRTSAVSSVCRRRGSAELFSPAGSALLPWPPPLSCDDAGGAEKNSTATRPTARIQPAQRNRASRVALILITIRSLYLVISRRRQRRHVRFDSNTRDFRCQSIPVPAVVARRAARMAARWMEDCDAGRASSRIAHNAREFTGSPSRGNRWPRANSPRHLTNSAFRRPILSWNVGKRRYRAVKGSNGRMEVMMGASALRLRGRRLVSAWRAGR